MKRLLILGWILWTSTTWGAATHWSPVDGFKAKPECQAQANIRATNSLSFTKDRIQSGNMVFLLAKKTKQKSLIIKWVCFPSDFNPRTQ